MPFTPIPGQAPVEITETVAKSRHLENVGFLEKILETELNVPGSYVGFTVESKDDTGRYTLVVNWWGEKRPSTKELASLTSEEAAKAYKEELEVVARLRKPEDVQRRSVVREEEI